jgi:hypothetical protein
VATGVHIGSHQGVIHYQSAADKIKQPFEMIKKELFGTYG